MTDPRLAHHLDGRTLLGLLPHVDQSDLHEIRQQFAGYLSTPAARRPGVASWQEAWNAWTGATPARPGQIEYTPARCRECKGRGWSTKNIGRNLARTGNPSVCHECSGNRRGRRTRQVARYAPVPTRTEDQGRPGDETATT